MAKGANQKLKILVGNSATITNRHEEIFNLLTNLENKETVNHIDGNKVNAKKLGGTLNKKNQYLLNNSRVSNENEKIKLLTSVIDKQIYKNYFLKISNNILHILKC